MQRRACQVELKLNQGHGRSAGRDTEMNHKCTAMAPTSEPKIWTTTHPRRSHSRLSSRPSMRRSMPSYGISGQSWLKTATRRAEKKHHREIEKMRDWENEHSSARPRFLSARRLQTKRFDSALLILGNSEFSDSSIDLEAAMETSEEEKKRAAGIFSPVRCHGDDASARRTSSRSERSSARATLSLEAEEEDRPLRSSAHAESRKIRPPA